MKTKKLIEMVQKLDPTGEGTVTLHDPIGSGGEKVIFVSARLNENDIWLETRSDCDWEYQLNCWFDELKAGDVDLYSFYENLLDHGVYPDEVRKFIGWDAGDKMEAFCEEHGLLAREEYMTSSKERYLVYQDFNTKDWIVYDNETDCNICHCDTEEEANGVLEGLQ